MDLTFLESSRGDDFKNLKETLLEWLYFLCNLLATETVITRIFTTFWRKMPPVLKFPYTVMLRTETVMPHPCHIVVAGNPAIIYASRGGTPDRVLPILKPFLETFWQERDLSGEESDTAECLVAQITVRFGFEICEDDFSNLRVGIHYNPKAEYVYFVSPEHDISVWVAEAAYRQQPTLGLKGCRPWKGEG